MVILTIGCLSLPISVWIVGKCWQMFNMLPNYSLQQMTVGEAIATQRRLDEQEAQIAQQNADGAAVVPAAVAAIVPAAVAGAWPGVDID
jgi:hypothetical protein